MKVINRVVQYIDFKGLNKSTFEREIGLSNGYIGTQLKRNADLGESIINKILDYCLDVDPEWLLTGKGSMLKTVAPPSDNCRELLEAKEREIQRQDQMIAALQDHIATLKKNEADSIKSTAHVAKSARHST